MNKEEFINLLSDKTGYSNDKCIIINSVLEDNFLIGRKNKNKIVNQLRDRLGLDDVKANEIYEISMDLLNRALKNRLKHPFKNLDK